jgi:hypothetical protein
MEIFLELQEQWRRVYPRAASGKSQAPGGSGRLSSPLPFCTGGEKQGHLQSQENATTSWF